jgi:hypothetical protein
MGSAVRFYVLAQCTIFLYTIFLRAWLFTLLYFHSYLYHMYYKDSFIWVLVAFGIIWAVLLWFALFFLNPLRAKPKPSLWLNLFLLVPIMTLYVYFDDGIDDWGRESTYMYSPFFLPALWFVNTLAMEAAYLLRKRSIVYWLLYIAAVIPASAAIGFFLLFKMSHH